MGMPEWVVVSLGVLGLIVAVCSALMLLAVLVMLTVTTWRLFWDVLRGPR